MLAAAITFGGVWASVNVVVPELDALRERWREQKRTEAALKTRAAEVKETLGLSGDVRVLEIDRWFIVRGSIGGRPVDGVAICPWPHVACDRRNVTPFWLAQLRWQDVSGGKDVYDFTFLPAADAARGFRDVRFTYRTYPNGDSTPAWGLTVGAPDENYGFRRGWIAGMRDFQDTEFAHGLERHANEDGLAWARERGLRVVKDDLTLFEAKQRTKDQSGERAVAESIARVLDVLGARAAR